jgi:2-keto-4-pentenoate hydratase/2-oxohepta-3-ene-1,7-dioic acid hydratase in catechol pathway
MSRDRGIRAFRHEAIFEGNPTAVGKIICVGRNYARHVEEMGEKANADPVFFLKPPTALMTGGSIKVSVPMSFGELHHEVELAVLVGRRGRALDPTEAQNYVAGYAVALDLTLRDLQSKAKTAGEPWALAKGFDGSAPTGPFIAREGIADPHDLGIQLEVNGQLKQSARTSSMIHRVEDLFARVSRFMTLEPGDVLLTGTPEGVGPLAHGDRLLAHVDGLPDLYVEVVRPPEGVIEARGS